MAAIQSSLGSPAASAPTNPVLTPQLLTRIRAEYREMPGLRLTLLQAVGSGESTS